MNKAELVDAISAEAKMSRADAERALNATMNNISKALKKGDRISLVGFGSFSVTKRAARVGRNPATGKEIQIPARKAIKFKPGTELTNDINKR